MNRNNSSANSQKKYIKLNLKNILKGGADEPEPDHTMVPNHPGLEGAYDLTVNNDGEKTHEHDEEHQHEQTGGKLTLPYDPFAPHNPLQHPLSPLIHSPLSPMVPNNITNLYPINGPNGGVGLSTVSPTPYRMNPHSFPSNSIQNIKIPVIPSNYMLPGPSMVNSGPFIANIGYNLGVNRFGSHALRNYLRRVVNTLEILLSRRRHAGGYQRIHINNQISLLREQIDRAIRLYSPARPNRDERIINQLRRIRNLF